MGHDYRCVYSSAKRIAITGATGFVGTQVVSAFLNSNFYPISISEIPDSAIVIHCAADLNQSNDALIGNIERDLRLIEEVSLRHSGLIYLSGNNIYSKMIDCRISDRPRMNDYYSAAKVIGESMVENMMKKPWCILRVADVFGKGQRHGNFFKALESAVKRDEPIKLFGAGLKLRSYIYAPELARYVVFLANKMSENIEVPRVVNVCHLEPLTLKEIAQFVSDHTGLPLEEVPQQNDISHLDIRTMQPGPFDGYEFDKKTLQDALLDYIKEVR